MIRTNKHRLLVLLFIFPIISHAQKNDDWTNLIFRNDIPFQDIQKAFDAEWKGKAYKSGHGINAFKRFEYLYQNRLDKRGNFIKTSTYEKEYDKIRSNVSSNDRSVAWAQVGPLGMPNSGNGVGRINVVAFHPNNPNILFAGAPAGGLWKSYNGGNYWTSSSDDFQNLGISDIVVDPANPSIVYATTGDNDHSDTSPYGLIKSMDGGITWDVLSLEPGISGYDNFWVMDRVLLDPTNSNRLLVATNLGIYESLDAGDSWDHIFQPDVRVRHMEFHPTNPSIIYATTDGYNSNGNDSDFYVSYNSGVNWFHTIVPDNIYIQRMAIAVSPDRPNDVYLLASSDVNSNDFHAVLKSENRGYSFTKVPTTDPPNLGSQEWYDWTFSVDPLDHSHMYAGGVGFYESFDGGLTWSYALCDQNYTYCIHVDFHYSGFHPITGELFVGNDGGIFKTPTNNLDWTPLNDGLAVTQYYRISTSETTSNFSIGGSQDNGTHRFDAGYAEKIYGGDGMDNDINYLNDQIFYISTQRGYLRKTFDGGQSFSSMINPNTTDESGSWVTPFKIDPNDPSILVAGFNNIWKSQDYGNNWTKMTDFSEGSTFQHLDFAPSNSNYMYGSKFGDLYATVDGGTTWNVVLDSYIIRWIEIDQFDPQHLWLASDNSVIESFDGGYNWEDISNNLPDIPTNTLVYDHDGDGKLFVGTDIGVFYRTRSDREWLEFNVGLPNVRVFELDINETNGQIYAGTYGRGMWKSNLPAVNAASCEIVDVNISSPFSCNNGDISYEVSINYNQAPLTGGISINNVVYPTMGSGQTFTIENLSEGMTYPVSIYFEDNPSCSYTTTLDIPAECTCTNPNYIILEEFYHQAGGDLWDDNSGWLENCDPCNNWYGVTCYDGKINRLRLDNNNLIGNISPDIGSLSDLTYLNLGTNELTGSIPGELGDLINLDYLKLSFNDLSGTLPPELGDLENLYSMYLYGNELTGNIPSEYGQLKDLRYLSLYSNMLNGSIPSQLGNLNSLSRFDVSNNQISGTIPSALGNIPDLSSLYLSGNALYGTIPNNFSNLTNLKFIDLSFNDLYGVIPDIFSNMNELQRITLSYNNFTGNIPESIAISPELTSIYLNDNNLSGCIPNSMSKICSISADLANNSQLPYTGDIVQLCMDLNVWCQNPCIDGYQNFDETGLDCGGSECSQCECTASNTLDRSLIHTYSFEEELSGWRQHTDDGAQWEYGYYQQYYQTGPEFPFDYNTFLYIKPNYQNNNAILESECLDLTSFYEPILDVPYHMYGVDVKSLTIEYSVDDGNTWQTLYTVTGDQGNQWQSVAFFIPRTTDKIRFNGETGTDYYSVIALDGISIYDNCRDDLVIGGAINLNFPADVFTIETHQSIESRNILSGPGKFYFNSPAIKLVQPFEVENGTTFETLLNGCEYSQDQNGRFRSIQKKSVTPMEVSSSFVPQNFVSLNDGE